MSFSAGILLGSFATALLAAPPERFDPERHFPRDCYVYYNFNIGGLRAGCRETPLGRLFLHPGVQKALGKLPDLLREKLQEGTTEFRAVVGREPWEILDLLSGEVAFTIAGVDMLSGPRLLFAVDLAPRRKELLEIVAKVESFISNEAGDEAARQVAEVGGIEVTTWAPRFGPSVQYGVLGSSFVFSVGIGMDSVVERFTKDGEGSEDALRFNPAFARAKLQASGFTPAVTMFVNWEAIRTTIGLFMGEIPMAQEVQKAFVAIGLDKLASVIYRTGFRAGDFEMKLHLDSPGGLGGLLGLLGDCLGPPEATSPPGGFPTGSEDLAAASYSVGRLARGIVEGISEIHPQAKAAVDGFLSEMERATGITVDELYTLPKLTVFTASVRPAAGGLVPDTVALVRSSQFEPYLVLLDKAGRKLGARVTSVKAGERDVAYMVLSNFDRKLGFPAASSPFAQGVPAVPVPVDGEVGEEPELVFLAQPVAAWAGPAQILAQMESHLTLAFAPIDDEWMVVATTPQGVSRHLAALAAKAEAAADPALARLIDKEIGSGAAFSVMRGGRNFIAAYNTLASIAVLMAPSFEKELKTYGVDLAHLPAGEELAGAFGDGFALVRASKDGLTVHSHRLLSNLVGNSSTISSLLIPLMAAGLKRSLQQSGGATGPEERLKALGVALKAYAEGPGAGAYPYDGEGTLAALESVLANGELADEQKQQLLELLVRPGSAEKPAVWRGEETEISAGNVSYELVPWKQGPRDNPARLLAYEKRSHSGSGRWVLFVDLTVRELAEEELQTLLADQKRKYAKAVDEEEAGDEEKAEEDTK